MILYNSSRALRWRCIPPLTAMDDPLQPPPVIVQNSFMDRVGNHRFHDPSIVWGYLLQVNEWARGLLEWQTDRVGGKDHIPIFSATPVCASKSPCCCPLPLIGFR